MPGENGSEAHSPERLPACAAAERPGRATTARRVHGLTPLGIGASRESVHAEPERLAPGRLTRRNGLYMLRGRDGLVETRRRRAADAARLWPEAVRYGRLLAELPFVRMVAVTGSLTRDNVTSGGDIDYLLVTAAGRVWVGRGLAGVVRRAVRRRGTHLCPNYVLSEQALMVGDRNLFTAN